MLPIGRQTIVITACLISLAAGSFFLVLRESSQRHPWQGKDWWAISFSDPLSPGNCDAVLENRSPQDSFEYEIFVDGMGVARGNLVVPTGSSAAIESERVRIDGQKVRIEVRDADGTKKSIQKR